MLTFVLQAGQSTLLLIDEPDIYLHSDLQRQLIGILRGLGVQIILATHSVEIISEVESAFLLNINKRHASAHRLTNSKELQDILRVLGSNANPILTQLAKARRVVFVEGKDFQMLSRFARILGYKDVASRSDFAVVPVEGFQPQTAKHFASGIEATLGSSVLKAVIFDRDYRASEDVGKRLKELEKFCAFAVIHGSKEIENFLLIPAVLDKAITVAAAKNASRSGKPVQQVEPARELLERLSESLRLSVFGQFVARRKEWMKQQQRGLDEATITTQLVSEFETAWKDFETRMQLLPGKELISELNSHLQSNYGITLTWQAILDRCTKQEVPVEMVALIEGLETFRKASPP